MVHDYSFAIKDTIQFAIKRGKPLADYTVHVHHDGDSEVSAIKSMIDTGHCLTFSFTEGYGNLVTFETILYDC